VKAVMKNSDAGNAGKWTDEATTFLSAKTQLYMDKRAYV
jgi:hypothetical protein